MRKDDGKYTDYVRHTRNTKGGRRNINKRVRRNAKLNLRKGQ
jgi:hypothetical protein